MKLSKALRQYRGHKGSLAVRMLLYGAAVFTIGLLLFLIAYILVKGIPNLTPELFAWKYTSENVSMLPSIINTLLMTGLTLLLAVPIGVGAAVYMTEYAKTGSKLVKVVRITTETLQGIPSIVYGFFGLMVIVPLVQDLFGAPSGQNMLTASILLGIMILPTIISVSESSIRAVPDSYYEGALALGASHERSVFFVTVPAAKSGIMAGIILGVGRAIGETMAVIMIAGNQPRIPDSLLEGVRTLTGNIVMEMGYAQGLHREALIATGVVLFVFILIINLLFSILKRKESKA